LSATTSTTSSEFEPHFAFGKNWLRFLRRVDEARIEQAKKSFLDFVGPEPLSGASFLDVGCGSGLSSLVARRCGMRVAAFDYDPDAVACSIEMRRRFGSVTEHWTVERGDALDTPYMKSLGRFDLVYAWGSLHHTGDLWLAVENAAACVRDNGRFYLAVYNDQGGTSRRWLVVKKLYQKLPASLRVVLVGACAPILWWKDMVRDLLRGRPLATWLNYAKERGMSPWHDLVDWVGGYPFEVAKPEQVLDFLRARGFSLEKLRTCGGGSGCNEFMFRKASPVTPQAVSHHSSSILPN
jgi:2-polyprenyl-6-hydroxyphenyl methylase/3-demethylubiquinone-9 3-methyltransferase